MPLGSRSATHPGAKLERLAIHILEERFASAPRVEDGVHALRDCGYRPQVLGSMETIRETEPLRGR